MKRLTSAQVVIIGGGVVGCAVAYFLARRGCTDVVLLERNTLSSGSTGAAAGGIRQQFSTEINIRFSQASLAFFRRFAEETEGGDAGYRPIGYLFLATTERLAQLFARNVQLQQRLGVPVRLLSPSEAHDLVPSLAADDVRAATWGAEDGVIRPIAIADAFATYAARRGVRIRERCPVTAIEVSGGRVQAVVAGGERIATPVVVNAAGPWAAEVGQMAGVDIPVQPFRRELFLSQPLPALRDLPLIIDLAAEWYARGEGAQVLMSGARDREPSFKRHVDWDGLPTYQAHGARRLPPLAEARFIWARAGLYEVTPDNHAILGPVPGVDGFICACGFSGHGVQHSPAAGRAIADLILDGRASEIDITPLSLARFHAGRPLAEPLAAHAGGNDTVPHTTEPDM